MDTVSVGSNNEFLSWQSLPGPLSGSEACECTKGMEKTTEKGSEQRFLLDLVGTKSWQPPGCYNRMLMLFSHSLPAFPLGVCHLSRGIQRWTQKVGHCWMVAFWLTNTDNSLPRQLEMTESHHAVFKGCGGFTYSCFCVWFTTTWFH